MHKNHTSLSSFSKDSEFTYGIQSARVFELLGGEPMEDFNYHEYCHVSMSNSEVEKHLSGMEGYVMGGVRSLVEKSDLFRQVIPYPLAWKWVNGNNISPVRAYAVRKRNKRDEEGRVTSKLSIGLGGRLENNEVVTYLDVSGKHPRISGVIDLVGSLDLLVQRKLEEDIRFALFGTTIMPNSVKKIGFVFDAKPTLGYQGNHHLGVIYEAQVPSNATFETRWETDEVVGWATIETLMEMMKDYREKGEGIPFEPWSALIITRLSEVLEMSRTRTIQLSTPLVP